MSRSTGRNTRSPGAPCGSDGGAARLTGECRGEVASEQRCQHRRHRADEEELFPPGHVHRWPPSARLMHRTFTADSLRNPHCAPVVCCCTRATTWPAAAAGPAPPVLPGRARSPPRCPGRGRTPRRSPRRRGPSRSPGGREHAVGHGWALFDTCLMSTGLDGPRLLAPEEFPGTRCPRPTGAAGSTGGAGCPSRGERLPEQRRPDERAVAVEQEPFALAAEESWRSP